MATEITLLAGPPVVVEGELRDVESALLAAARGSIMELVWLTEVDAGEAIGINPDHVVAIRAVRG